MCVPGKTILKSSATSVTTLTHMDNRSFLTVLVCGKKVEKHSLAKDMAEANTLDIYLSLSFKITKLDSAYTSANIFVKESC